VVFTLPAELRPLAQRNPRRIYDLLFATFSGRFSLIHFASFE
jgi:hypothetical protein